MADTGNGKMIDLLERIALGVENTNVRLDETNVRLGKLEGHAVVTNQRLEKLEGHAVVTNQRLEKLEKHAVVTNQRLEKLDRRVDNIVSFMGNYHADHERRITTLEHRVLKKKSGS